jgi:hypothetical protein
MDWFRSLGTKVVAVLAALAIIGSSSVALADDDDQTAAILGVGVIANDDCVGVGVGGVAISDDAAAATSTAVAVCD